MVFVVVAKLTAKGEAEAEELLGIMAKAAASYRQDPGTLSWHIARGAKDKTQLVAFERALPSRLTFLMSRLRVAQVVGGAHEQSRLQERQCVSSRSLQ